MNLFLQLLANAIQSTPAVHDGRTVAVFDVWAETPGTGWYEMCQKAGCPGYDGVNAAFALELED